MGDSCAALPVTGLVPANTYYTGGGTAANTCYYITQPNIPLAAAAFGTSVLGDPAYGNQLLCEQNYFVSYTSGNCIKCPGGQETKYPGASSGDCACSGESSYSSTSGTCTPCPFIYTVVGLCGSSPVSVLQANVMIAILAFVILAVTVYVSQSAAAWLRLRAARSKDTTASPPHTSAAATA